MATGMFWRSAPSFIPDSILDHFERRAQGRADQTGSPAATSAVRVDVAARMRQMWD
jgi:hypothetical protein